MSVCPSVCLSVSRIGRGGTYVHTYMHISRWEGIAPFGADAQNTNVALENTRKMRWNPTFGHNPPESYKFLKNKKMIEENILQTCMIFFYLTSQQKCACPPTGVSSIAKLIFKRSKGFSILQETGFHHVLLKPGINIFHGKYKVQSTWPKKSTQTGIFTIQNVRRL